MKAYAVQVTTAFDQSRERFETVLAWLSGPESAGLTHAELEDHLQVASREVFCQLLQDHLDLRAQQEPKLAGVVGADQVARHTIEAGGRAHWRRCSATCAWNAWPTVPAPTPTCTPPMRR